MFFKIRTRTEASIADLVGLRCHAYLTLDIVLGLTPLLTLRAAPIGPVGNVRSSHPPMKFVTGIVARRTTQHNRELTPLRR
jgi:hypothetical protein